MKIVSVHDILHTKCNIDPTIHTLTYTVEPHYKEVGYNKTLL